MRRVFAWVMPHLVSYLRSEGHDAAPITRLPGLAGEPLDDPDLRVPEESAREAWRLASTITGDEALGLHVAQWVPRGALDLVEYAFRSSPTFAIGLARLGRYGRLLNDRVTARLLPLGPELRILVAPSGEKHLHPRRVEFSLALTLRLARETTGSDLCPTEVVFSHDAPADTFEHRRFFRAPLRFGALVSTIAFAAADGARPLTGADAALSHIVSRRLEKALPPPGGALAERVRRWLLDQVGRQDVSATRTARELGVAARTLTRQLAAEGTSFRTELDCVRREIATALLYDRQVGIGEIAFFLGYSEPAAFNRSFKRWTGQGPLAYRRGINAA